jgi:hypothetical protein
LRKRDTIYVRLMDRLAGSVADLTSSEGDTP